MIIALHIIATYILLKGVLPYFKKYQVPINIHTLPKILLGVLVLGVSEYLCIKHFISCIPSGVFLGIILVWLQSSKIAVQPFSLTSRLFSFIGMIFCWPEFTAFLIFHFTCMPIDEKSKP